MTDTRRSRVARWRPDPAATSTRGWIALLARPLALDDHRAEFWVRHLRVGVALTEGTVILGLAYVLGADRPHRAVIAGFGLATMVLAPLLLKVPIRSWCRDLRGAAFFYAWSLATISFIALVSVLDGGGQSALLWLFTLALTYAGLAYPPAGVVVTGVVIVTTHTLCASAGSGRSADVSMQSAVLVLLTMMVLWISRNQWELLDDQHELTLQLARHADTDPLTSCLSRRAFAERLEAAASEAGPGRPVSLCMIDLDGFKAVNDTAGHAAGDELLALIADSLRAGVRERDEVGRLGGDEFAVLLPGATTEVAREVGERLRVGVELAGGDFGVTASLGIVTAARPAQSHMLLVAADGRMYDAKRAGGNQLLQVS